jgi:hypothetical protein
MPEVLSVASADTQKLGKPLHDLQLRAKLLVKRADCPTLRRLTPGAIGASVGAGNSPPGGDVEATNPTEVSNCAQR